MKLFREEQISSIEKNLDKIKELNSHKNLPEICEILGLRYRDSKAILEHIFKFKVTRHSHNEGVYSTEIPTNEIINLLEEGKSLLSICDERGLPYHTVYGRIKKMRPELLSRGDRSEDTLKRMSEAQAKPIPINDMVADYKSGMSMREVGEKYGVSAATIHHRLKKEGVELNDLKIYWTEERKAVQKKKANDGEIGVHLHGRNGYRNPSSTEGEFIKYCKNNGIEIEPQFQIMAGGHRYDFRISGSNVLVELDGVYWHNPEKQREKDTHQEIEAMEYGYEVIRFTDVEIAKSGSKCFDSIHTQK